MVPDGFDKLAARGFIREYMTDKGLACVRRRMPDESRFYFIANRSEEHVNDWIGLPIMLTTASLMDPMTGNVGMAACRPTKTAVMEVRLNLAPGQSVILRAFTRSKVEGPAWPDWNYASMTGVPIEGKWNVEFISGGPTFPASFTTERLASWTELGDTNAASFAGTAVYSLKFDATGDRLKAGLQTFQLDLGKVCQSARVRLNGKDYGTLFTPPFRVVVDNLKAKDNLLEVEVTSTSANRIRDLDRRGVKWKNFHDINFVNLNYQKFDASNWPLADSGLLGPVTLTPVSAVNP
jgi:hypothetical protein